MPKKSVRPYLATSPSATGANILAPNGRIVARSHSARTTRRLLAVLNGGHVSQSDRFSDRAHHAPSSKVHGAYQILSANGRVVVSCTSRYVQLMLQEHLDQGAPAKELRAYRKRDASTAEPAPLVSASAGRGRKKFVAHGTRTGRIACRTRATSAKPSGSRAYTGPAFSRSAA